MSRKAYKRDDAQPDLFVLAGVASFGLPTPIEQERAEEHAIATAEAAAELDDPASRDDDENERGEWRDEHERQHRKVMALAETAKIEELVWMEGKKRAYSRGNAYLVFQWFEHEGLFYSRHELSSGTGSSSGPFCVAKGVTNRDELLLQEMRSNLSRAAHRYAMRDWGSDGESDWKTMEKFAAWCIDQCPPLMFGADLAQEFEALKAQHRADEEERRRMLKDVHDLREQLVDAMYRAEGRDKPDHVSDWWRNLYGSGGDVFARADVQLQGDWPNRLRVMIYSARPHYQGDLSATEQDSPEQLEAWRAALEPLMSVPVVVASRELQEAHYYDSARREVTWPSDRSRAYHLRVLQLEELDT